MQGVAYCDYVYVAHDNVHELAFQNILHDDNGTATVQWKENGETEVVSQDALVTVVDYAMKYCAGATASEKATGDADASSPRK